MGLKRDKKKIKDLKGQLKEAKRSYARSHWRLLKLTIIVVILAVVVAILHEKMQILDPALQLLN